MANTPTNPKHRKLRLLNKKKSKLTRNENKIRQKVVNRTQKWTNCIVAEKVIEVSPKRVQENEIGGHERARAHPSYGQTRVALTKLIGLSHLASYLRVVVEMIEITYASLKYRLVSHMSRDFYTLAYSSGVSTIERNVPDMMPPRITLASRPRVNGICFLPKSLSKNVYLFVYITNIAQFNYHVVFLL